jgi:type VI secretion system protein ImpH
MAVDGRPAPDRLNGQPWLERLLERPGRFDFHTALWRFDAQDPARPRLGEAERPSEEPVRVGQAPSAAFAGAEVSEFRAAAEGLPARLTVAFLGLWGPNGPLPTHMTEYAHERVTHAGDATLARFADIFHHRILLLFYRAWAVGLPTTSIGPAASNAFTRYVGALMGLGLSTTRERGGASDFSKLYYAPFFAGSHSAEGLRDLLEDYFGVPVAVEEWVGQSLDLPDDEQWRLGARDGTSSLGRAVLGARVWSRASKFRIRFGPLRTGEFERMLPGSDALEALSSLVRLYTNDEWDWDVRLVLSAAHSEPMCLGRKGRLGWTARLGSGPQAAVDVLVDPRTGSTRRVGGAPGLVRSR